MANDNPAGRLLELMWQAWEIRPRDPSAPAVDVWGEVLELDPARCRPQIQRITADLRVSAHQIPDLLYARDHEVVGLEVMIEHYNKVLKTVDNFAVVERANIDQFFQPMDDAGWSSLKMIDAALAKIRPEPTLDPKQVQRLLGKVRDLADAVLKDGSLDDDMQNAILSHLRDIEQALVEAKIYGSDGVSKATQRLFGDLLVRKDLWDRIAESKYGKRVGFVASGLMLVLSSAGGLPALGVGSDAPPVNPVYIQIEVGKAIDDPTQVSEGEVVEGEVVVGPPTAPPGEQSSQDTSSK